jgi:hypothetical protein
VKGAVRDAFVSIVATFPGVTIRSYPDGQGGLWVELVAVSLTDGPYVQDSTFMVFLLPFNLPGADVYPVFVREELPRPVLQLSRRTRAGKFTAQTPAQKVVKVLDWLATR